VGKDISPCLTVDSKGWATNHVRFLKVSHGQKSLYNGLLRPVARPLKKRAGPILVSFFSPQRWDGPNQIPWVSHSRMTSPRVVVHPTHLMMVTHYAIFWFSHTWWNVLYKSCNQFNVFPFLNIHLSWSSHIQTTVDSSFQKLWILFKLIIVQGQVVIVLNLAYKMLQHPLQISPENSRFIRFFIIKKLWQLGLLR